MPIDREDDRIARSPASYRKQLVNGTGGMAIEAPPFSLRVSNIPLFEQRGDDLFQAVRVRIQHSGEGQELLVRLRNGSRIIAEQQCEATDKPQSAFLLVPEVSETLSLTFEAESNGALVEEADFAVTPQKKWTIHLIHHSHYDIGYTDPQSQVMSSQLDYIDEALALCSVTDDWPDAARFRWNIEVNWPLKQWLITRPKWARDELLRRVKEGRIEIHALPFSMHTEAYSFDELAEQLRYTHQLREDYGIDIVSAMQTDVPGATVGLSTLLTDAGVRYFSVAHNYAGRSIPHMVDGQDLKRPFYWEAPDGDRVLVWYTDTLHGIAYMEAMTLGFGTGYEDVLGSLPEYLNALSERPYPYGDSTDWVVGSLAGIPLTKTSYPYDILNLRVQAAFADNASTSLVPSDIVREWNTRWAYPRLRMSLNRDFFSEAEANIGDQLETYRGDWTDWWADGIGSGAVPLAKNRQAQSDIRTAQTLNAIADGLTDNRRPELAQYFQAAYEDMALFDEHTWGAANPWEQGASGMSSGEYQWTRKSAFAYSAEEKVRTLLEGAIQRIAPLAATPRQEPDGTSLLVFNPSTFTRTDLVKIFLPERQLDTVPVELIDLTTGGTIPFIIEPQINSKHRLRGQYIRFLARDIPPIGYARYAVTSGRGKNSHKLSSNHTHGEPTTLATEMLSADIDVSTATVRSMKDVQSDVELIADSAPYGFNAYIFDRYASAPRFNHLSSRIGNAGPWLLGSRGSGHFGHVVERESNSIWERITLRYEGDGADWLESTLTLPHGVARLHISNRLHKPSILEKESVYFAFPFAMDDPNITFQITGGTASNDSPHVPGSANHFRAIRHWATLTAPDTQPVAWATTDAPLVQMGNIYLPYAPFPKTIDEQDSHRSTIYSWALNNIWDTNFPPRQGGEMQFRYTIATNADSDPMALGADTGESAATPLVGVVAPMGAAGEHNIPDRSSFIDVPNPSVKVSHLMASRSGEGITIILESEATEQTETTVTLQHLPVVGAKVGTFWETDLVETALEGNTVSLSIDPGELKSVVFRFR